MSFTTVTPPRAGEVLAAIQALLDVAAVQALLGGSGRVVLRGADLPGLTRTAIGRLVVMRRNTATRSEHLDRVRYADFNIRLDFYLPKAGFNPDAYSEAVHAEVFTLLEGQGPSMTYAGVAHPLRRIVPPSVPTEDDDAKTFYSRSVYRIALKAA